MPSPRQSYQTSTTTLLLFALLIACLFPGLFHKLWTLPLSLLGLSTPDPVSPRHRAANTPPTADMATVWTQKQFSLPAKSRGSYLITNEITSAIPEIREYKVGILHLFMQHTSCGLSLNENWDSDVREDMSDALDRIAPEYGPKGEALYRHDAEGPDDMPAHIKSALVGASVTIPIKDGKLVSFPIIHYRTSLILYRQRELGRASGTSSSVPISTRAGSWPPSKAKRPDGTLTRRGYEETM
jgi:secondary thiamine-phosphate synthase enzyme